MMVNITDTFTRMYGRPPTQSEIALMMEMKAKQDAYRNRVQQPDLDAFDKHKNGKRDATRYGNLKINKSKERQTASVPPIIIQINKMLWYKLTAEQVADVLNKDVEKINEHVKKYNLPRQGLQAIEYKRGPRK